MRTELADVIDADLDLHDFFDCCRKVYVLCPLDHGQVKKGALKIRNVMSISHESLEQMLSRVNLLLETGKFLVFDGVDSLDDFMSVLEGLTGGDILVNLLLREPVGSQVFLNLLVHLL